MTRFAHSNSGFTLTEVLIAQGIAGLVFAGILVGFNQSAVRSEWSAYSLAAQSLAMQKIEQARAAKWDPLAYPQVDELVTTNFPIQIAVMDIPVMGTNYSFGTNITTIRQISSHPPVKQIEVECSWAFRFRDTVKVFTNRVMAMRGPDQ